MGAGILELDGAKSKNWCSFSAKQGRQRGKKLHFYPIRVFEFKHFHLQNISWHMQPSWGVRGWNPDVEDCLEGFSLPIPLARSCVHNAADTKIKCIDCTKCIFCILWICVCTCVHVISGFVTCTRRQCTHGKGRLNISLHFRKSFKQPLTRPPLPGTHWHLHVLA